jgi:hypothetical protein
MSLAEETSSSVAAGDQVLFAIRNRTRPANIRRDALNASLLTDINHNEPRESHDRLI